jgi:hypothetical protein
MLWCNISTIARSSVVLGAAVVTISSSKGVSALPHGPIHGVIPLVQSAFLSQEVLIGPDKNVYAVIGDLHYHRTQAQNTASG